MTGSPGDSATVLRRLLPAPAHSSQAGEAGAEQARVPGSGTVISALLVSAVRVMVAFELTRIIVESLKHDRKQSDIRCFPASLSAGKVDV